MIERIFERLNSRLPDRLQIGRLGRNSIYGSVGLAVRAVIQALYLLLMSRWLGATRYGEFSGSVAFVIIAAPLAGWGMPLLIAKWVARDRLHAPAMWATALVQIAVVGSALVGVILLVAPYLPHLVDLRAVLMIGLSELLLLPIGLVATSYGFALERGLASLVLVCLIPACRLMTGILAVLVGFAGTPLIASATHFVGSIIGAAAIAFLVGQTAGWPVWRRRLPFHEGMKQGWVYALGGVVGTSYLEVDKVLMLQLLGGVVLGPYTVAFRVTSLFGMPVSALIGAALPRMMASHRTQDQLRTFKAVLGSALVYGLVASLSILIIAPVVPMIFGAGYSDAICYTYLFAPWPILFAAHQTYAARVTASDRQGARVSIEGVVMLLMVVANIFLLHRLGPDASIMVLLMAEAMMTFGCWLIMRPRPAVNL